MHTQEPEPRQALRIKAKSVELVKRARAGDQNAMGTLVEIRRSSRRNPKAAYAFRCCESYIKSHPSTLSTNGIETKFGGWGNAFTSLAKGVTSPKRISRSVKRATSKQGLRNLKKAAKQSAPYMKVAASVVALVPGVGTGVAATISAAAAIAEGKDIDGIFIAAAAGAVPGGAAALETAEKAKEVNDGIDARAALSAKKGPDGKLSLEPNGDIETVTYKVRGKEVPSYKIFQAGFNCSADESQIKKLAKEMPDSNARKTLQVGFAIGRAYRIQGVLKRGKPISSLDTMVAWELGE